MKQTILTGIKNSGRLHIGSYLGAIKPMVELQKSKVKPGDYQMNMFIPDLHVLTVPNDYTKLKRFMLDNLKLYIACGFDISDANTFVYRQSRISAHSELCVLLNNFTGFGELSRQTQFKDQQIKGKEVSVGLFDYPVLMAADILLYGAKYVPVGDDQRQHLELTRDIAIRINNKFGDVFTVPAGLKEQVKFMGEEKSLRIMSLSSPDNKMSKSVSDPKGTIDLLDSPDEARKKIMSAETDSLASVNYDPQNQPGISNLIEIYAHFTDLSLSEAELKFKGSERYGDLKKEVADVVCEFLERIQLKFNDISDEEVLVSLEKGESAVKPTAESTLHKMQRKLGLRSKEVVAKSRAGKINKPSSIKFSEFARLDVRAGTIVQASKISGSDKLIKLIVNTGDDQDRQIVTGMLEFYSPEDFIGKQMLFLLNLETVKFMGQESQGMLLAIQGPSGPIFVQPEESVNNGSPLE
jgi:tryptophanyl-tRNA synthetase